MNFNTWMWVIKKCNAASFAFAEGLSFTMCCSFNWHMSEDNIVHPQSCVDLHDLGNPIQIPRLSNWLVSLTSMFLPSSAANFLIARQLPIPSHFHYRYAMPNGGSEIIALVLACIDRGGVNSDSIKDCFWLGASLTILAEDIVSIPSYVDDHIFLTQWTSTHECE